MRKLLDLAAGLIIRKASNVRKCVERQYNKVYVLTVSNGDELVARLPNLNAGPQFYTTASEVATRSFLRDVLKISVPRILALSADATNAVDAEYIIEEKATGQPLGRVWAQMSTAARLGIIDQLINVEKKLAVVFFPRLGCIYHASDVVSKSSSWHDLESVSISEFGFALGPANGRRLWQAERSQMPLNRGPLADLADHAVAIGTNELQWAGSHAVARINPHRSTEKPETPAQYIHLLQLYIKVAPYFVSHLQKTSLGYARNTLSHPDLPLDNIFIDPNTNRITCIIDWQPAAIGPLALQHSHPQMLELSASHLSDERHNQEKELLDYYHKAAKAAALPRPPSQNCDPHFSVCRTLLTLVTACWDRQEIFSLCQSLISVAAHWDNLDVFSDDHKTQTLCPINFTSEELQAHERESELISGIAGIVQQLDEQGLIPIGGMVLADEYDNTQAISEYFKKQFMDLAENEKQKRLHEAAWPYQ